jgi:hypothetical protein
MSDEVATACDGFFSDYESYLPRGSVTFGLIPQLIEKSCHIDKARCDHHRETNNTKRLLVARIFAVGF